MEDVVNEKIGTRRGWEGKDGGGKVENRKLRENVEMQRLKRREERECRLKKRKRK